MLFSPRIERRFFFSVDRRQIEAINYESRALVFACGHAVREYNVYDMCETPIIFILLFQFGNLSALLFISCVLWILWCSETRVHSAVIAPCWPHHSTQCE